MGGLFCFVRLTFLPERGIILASYTCFPPEAPVMQGAKHVGKKVVLYTKKVGYTNLAISGVIFFFIPGGAALSALWIARAIRRHNEHFLLTASTEVPDGLTEKTPPEKEVA